MAKKYLTSGPPEPDKIYCFPILLIKVSTNEVKSKLCKKESFINMYFNHFDVLNPTNVVQEVW